VLDSVRTESFGLAQESLVEACPELAEAALYPLGRALRSFDKLTIRANGDAVMIYGNINNPKASLPTQTRM